MKVWSASLHVGLGLGSFLAVASAIAAVRPGPSDFVVTDKLRYLARHSGRYDTLLVGSSLVYRHFVPTVIDESYAARGVPLRTFNVGGPGMKGFETDHVLRQALAAAGSGVRYVFLEPSRFTSELHDVNRRSERTVQWHTVTQTRAVLRQLLLEERPLVEKLSLAAEHLVLFAWNLSSYGDGPRILRRRLGVGPPPELGEAELAAAAGYRSLEDEAGEEFAARRRALLDDPEAYRRRVARLEAGGSGRAPAAADRAALAAQVATVRSAGAEPIYVVSPWPGGAGVFPALAEDGTIPTLLAFDDPERYPEFFRLEARFDANHLTSAAAARFSRVFADAATQALDERAERGE